MPSPGGRSPGWSTQAPSPVQWGWLGVASRRPPRGLPRGSPGAGLANSTGGGARCCPRGAAWSGYARSTGCHMAPSVQDRQAAARHHDLRHAAGRWGAYRARLAVNSRTRPDAAGHNERRPTTVPVLARDRFCWVAGQGFEPWKASADGFTVRCRSSPPPTLGAHSSARLRTHHHPPVIEDDYISSSGLPPSPAWRVR
jgi:hypothetical protein